MVTPKIEALPRLNTWSIVNWSLNIPFSGINLTPLQNNARLSGLFSADGSFYLNWHYDKSRFPTNLQYYIRISQRKTNTSHSNNLTNFIFMKKIANLVDINLRSYVRKIFHSNIEQVYLVRTAKILTNYIIISYLINFPLFTQKYICTPVFIDLYKERSHNKYLKIYFY